MDKRGHWHSRVDMVHADGAAVVSTSVKRLLIAKQNTALVTALEAVGLAVSEQKTETMLL